jgi:hypothetical protein
MPETTVDKYSSAIFPERQVGTPDNIGRMQTKPKTTLVQQGSQYTLGLGVLPPNTGHHSASYGFVYDIDHGN